MGHRNMIMSLAWSSDGTKVASSSSGTEGGELFVWDSRTGTRLRIFRGDPGTANYAVAWGQERSPGEEMLISGRDDGNLCWWDVQTGESVRVQKAHQGKIHALRRSRDGSKLASCGDDGAIIIWDLHSGDYLQTVRRNRAYERMDITGLTGITDAQRTSLISLGAIMRSN
jgi:WD40 repeat protein